MARPDAPGHTIGRNDGITAALWPPRNGPPEPARTGPVSLTKRERQIAHPIAEGLTNRQIGQRLLIGERTVDTHVSHILAKLGCGNRAQAAVILSTQVQDG